MSDPVWPHRQQPTRLPSLGFSRQEHWSGLPFPSPVHESEKWKWSHSVMSDSSRPLGLQPIRLLHPWDFPGKSTGVGCQCLLRLLLQILDISETMKHCIDQMVHFGFSLTCYGKPGWTFWPIQYLSFYEWLIAHITMFLKFIHVVTYGRLSLIFYGWIIFNCMYMLYSLYPFIQRWTFDCFYISQSWIMLHWRRGTYIFTRSEFSFLWTTNQKWIAASYVNIIFNYLRKCHVAFYGGYTIYIPNNTLQKCQILCMFTNTCLF